ncbi:MAG TPA: HEAT repeat domain-containing protein [Pyrinomonadaceae bacterium]|nr:HEAT repeat domain-containing protein [Pyrinomonadaceae bacterium]
MCQPDFIKTIARVTATLLLLVIAITPQRSASQTQEKIGPVTISNVSTHASANGTVVSIDANGPLNRAQTWQDREGYHVVVPAAGAQNAIKSGNGIKVRQLDRSLEIVIQTKPGASVTVQPMANRLNLNVEGKLDPRVEPDSLVAKAEKAPKGDDESAPSAETTRASKSGKTNDIALLNNAAAPAPPQSATANAAAASAPSEDAKSQIQTATGESSVMSDPTVLILLGVACIGGLLIVRHWRNKQSAPVSFSDNDGFEEFGANLKELTFDESDVPTKPASPSPNNSLQRKSPARLTVAMPASLYGAYQIDLEVAKLVQGQAHKMDVVASRAPDDRRAIEASLLKSINSATGDEDMQRRARAALEEYGFVARQSAALLSAVDPCERTSAARLLGDVKSSSSLPFLLEALYDSESQVRNQAVLSIGELRLPSAIGALLDIARKHPDVPGSLLSKALNACSLEGLDFFENGLPEPRHMSAVDARLLAEEIAMLEPTSPTEDLPESVDDEFLTAAQAQVKSELSSQRAEGIKLLAQFSVKVSVNTLASIARTDSESSLRATAITSLANINHESVFPAILIAMADESREVRAAAARSLSRLSFDRADAYARLSKSEDPELLRNVAEACVKAGIANQGIDRMANGDHQAYEAMSVVGLLAKAKSYDQFVSAIANHPNMDVRLALVYLLEFSEEASLAEKLRAILPEAPSDELSVALTDAIAKLEAAQGDSQPNGEYETAIQANSEFETQPEADGSSETGYESAPPMDFENGHADTQFECAPTGEPQEAEMSAGFAFEFAPASKDESEEELDTEPNPPQFESSGLPAPPIA